MIMQILLSSIIVPKTQDAARNFLRTSSVNFFENFIKPQKFNDTIRGVTIYSESKDQDGNLNNLYLKKENEDGFQITYAKKGVFKEFNKIPVLVLYDGETIKGGISGITNFSFTKSDFALNKEMFKNNGFSILKEKKIQIEKSEAEKFYKVHETKPFYNDLCAYLSSGPIVVMVLEKENAVLANRELMGATNPKDAEEGTIRKKYGISIDKNSVHGSDSIENAKIEIDFFFKD